MTAFRRFYGRKSRLLGDPEDLDVFAHQINPLLRRAEAEGKPAKPEEIVVEVGSGETITDRPVFRALLEEIEGMAPRSGGEMYVWEVSRLSRGSRSDRARIADALERAGILVCTASQTYDLADPDSDFMFALLSQQARREQVVFKLRTAARRRELLLAGEPLTGTAPWGYIWDRNPSPGRRRGHLIPHPERFPILCQICREVLTTSLARLASRYAHLGLNPSTLQWTLRNPAICGWPAQRYGVNEGQRPNNRNRYVILPRDGWQWPEQPGDYPAACTRAEWEAIQVTLDRRYTLKEKTVADADGWCVDIVRFAGHELRARRSSIGDRPVYEIEPDGRRGGRLWTLRQPVHDHATLALMEAFRRPETVLHSLAEYRSGVTAANAHSGSEAHRQRLQQEREARERELDDLLLREMRADPEEAASIARVRAALRAEVKRLTQALQQLEAPVLRLPELEEVADLLPKMARVFPAYWEEAPGEVKRAVARAMIRSLTVTVTPHPSGKQRYVRTYGPTVFQDWLPWGRENVGER